MVYELQENVLGLEIPVNESMIVNRHNSFSSLQCILLDSFFFQPVMFLQLPKEMSVRGEFAHNIEVILIVKVAIEADDVLVSEIVVDSQLFGHLVFYLLLPNHLLAYFFESADKIGLLMAE
jgi:hypothetical protein